MTNLQDTGLDPSRLLVAVGVEALVEVADVELRRLTSGVSGRIGEQELRSVAVRGDGMGAGVAITLEMIRKERLKNRLAQN